jgi:hypothetical protein
MNQTLRHLWLEGCRTGCEPPPARHGQAMSRSNMPDVRVRVFAKTENDRYDRNAIQRGQRGDGAAMLVKTAPELGLDRLVERRQTER